MRVLILGVDGYLGWPLALHLMNKGHKVSGLDNFVRRKRVFELGSDSLTPICEFGERLSILRSIDPDFAFEHFSLGAGLHKQLRHILDDLQPECIVHLAEQPSAPWSMADVESACETQHENIIGTLELLWAMKAKCPEAHLLKLGTMGEYGTPNCDIPEGYIPKRCLNSHIDELCPMGGLQFPRKAGSWYHLTKVHDTFNVIFACNTWGLCSTDIMQGPVYGVSIPDMKDEEHLTRFDYDECFGTVINRFCVQALLGHPLTVYGAGGQTRGYLPLKDSINCMTLAIENPPTPGEYRVFNQFESFYSVNELADLVAEAASSFGYETEVAHFENPRKEMEQHYYKSSNKNLLDLGYVPTKDILNEIKILIQDLEPYIDRIKQNVIVPAIRWDLSHRRSQIIKEEEV